ncbi:hypothetical protein Hgul01_04549 [Herpetosiphon gulosus]|uniref:PIN domain-containing protein n=1 Tax=Herpetosiphon gulosus TaxID=1973496 RepID=A0ABP9X8G7_9CHLR
MFVIHEIFQLIFPRQPNEFRHCITAHTYGSLKAAVLQHFGPKEKAKQRHTALHQRGFSENDLWIAAIALQYQLTLVSMDSDFQRMQAVVSLPTVRCD